MRIYLITIYIRRHSSVSDVKYIYAETLSCIFTRDANTWDFRISIM